MLIELFLLSYVSADLFFIETHRAYTISTGPEMLPVKFRSCPNNSRWIRIALFPFKNPITIAMLYLGGTLKHK